MIGLAGYALQGRAGLAGSPAAARAPEPLPPAMPVELASEFYGRFNSATFWLVLANSYMKRGDSASGVATLQSALRARPRDSELWIAFGNALVTHGGGRTSPAAELAYRRAAAAAPGHPGPAFFYGLARLRQGDADAALALWKQVLASAPPAASWRAGLELRIALVERLRSEQGAP